MNIDLAVVAEQLSNLKTGIDSVIAVFKTFPEVVQDFANAFTSSDVVNPLDPPADAKKDA